MSAEDAARYSKNTASQPRLSTGLSIQRSQAKEKILDLTLSGNDIGRYKEECGW
jgi:hypothetical protein